MQKRYSEITKNALLILAGAGLIAIAATSPYFLIGVAKAIIRHKRYNKNFKFKKNERKLARSLSGLNKNKIIISKEKDGKFTIELTEKGKKIVQEIMFDEMKIKRPKKWDEKWRIVIFDIPERKIGKQQRNLFRAKLQTIGFFQLQKSVWVCPFPCENEVRLICEIYGINQYVNIVTAEKIYNDNVLKKYFDLVE